MTFTNAADRRIAGHLPQGIDSMRYQQCIGTRSSRGKRGFGTSVTAANNNDVKLPASIGHWTSPGNVWAAQYTRLVDAT